MELRACPLCGQQISVKAYWCKHCRRNLTESPRTSVFWVRGIGSEIEVFEDKLTIAPKGAFGMTKGLKGTKTIPFTSITAIQHKKAGLTSGYLQFSLPGGNESRGGIFAAIVDENTFIYERTTSNQLIEQIKSYIEARMGEKQASASPAAQGGITD